MGTTATLTRDERTRQATVSRRWRFALVLGGGGMKGLAHAGALRALEERGWVPEVIVGTSIGALLGAAWANGMSTTEIRDVALSLQRHDVFAIAHRDMAFKRMRSRGLYHSAPLESLIRGFVGDLTFRELERELIVASVDINSGMQMFWGLPGLRDVPVADAVFASCALPGFFAPREIDGRYFVDGALADNLPVSLAATRGVDGLVAVDVGASSVLRAEIQEEGFAAVFARATEIVFQQLLEARLAAWAAPPLLLVQPRVEHVPMFSFAHTRELMDEGYRAMDVALDLAGDAVRSATGGIFPRRLIRIGVDRERCIGCGQCVARAAGGTFRMDEFGKAVGPVEPQEWSPVDGGFIRHCPTYAITARPAAGVTIGGASTDTAPAQA
jgi:NTE family protein